MITFFLAEMGDKTQLAAVALAAKYKSLLWVWLGTTLGMMISNIIGIVVGVVLGKRIPERLVKILSASIFIGFGFVGIWQNVSDPGMKWWTLGLSLLVSLAYILFLVNQGRRLKEKEAQ